MNTEYQDQAKLGELCEAADVAGRQPMIKLLTQMGFEYVETEKYNKVDIIFKDKKGKVWHCEVKNRSDKYREFKTHIIEIPKLEYLLAKENPMYCCIFGKYIYLYGRKALETATTANIYRPKYNVIASGTKETSCAEIRNYLATVYYFDEVSGRYIRTEV